MLLLILPIAAGQDWLAGEEYEVGLNIGSEFTLVAENEGYSVDYVSTVLAFFPEGSWQQEVLSFETTPEAKRINHHYEFKWLNPEAGDYEFNLGAEVKVKNAVKEVTEKIDFPASIDGEYAEWLAASEHIDSNDSSIVLQASSIAEGTDDLYAVVYDLAKWVNENIEYDISCGDRVEKASWVLNSLRGTCDEYTALLVAMCRALGIPARYIAGVAYSNIPEVEGFSPHAWAEVYFPGVGWVPFDATYGQFGFVDASHIILKESFDPDESSTTYEWKGLHADLDTKKLQINAYLIHEYGADEDYISLGADVEEDRVGFGSYNLIKAEVKNLKDYYVSTELYIAKPSELELEGRFDRLVLLKPNEKKTFYWLVKVPNNLKDDAVYTFPIEISSLRGAAAETEFSSSKSDKIYSNVEMEEKMGVEEEKVVSKGLYFSCDADKTQLMVNESSEIECVVKNTGNAFLDDLAVCMDTYCRYVDLGIQQTKQVYFMYTGEAAGEYGVLMKASNDVVHNMLTLAFEVAEAPGIEIAELEYPLEVDYADDFSIKFSLSKTSFSNPLAVVMRLYQESYERKWEISELSGDEGFVINLKGSDLNKGKNNFKLHVDFEDVQGNDYAVEEDFSITLKGVGFGQTIKIWFNRLARWIEGLFT